MQLLADRWLFAISILGVFADISYTYRSCSMCGPDSTGCNVATWAQIEFCNDRNMPMKYEEP